MVAGLSDSCDTNSDTINTLIESLISLFRHTFVEENPKDLAKYHLDEPHYEFELETIKGVKRQVYLGKENKSDSTFYARFDDSNEVFKVPSATLTYIDKPLTEIMQLFTYIVNYKKVDKLTVKVKGQPTKCPSFNLTKAILRRMYSTSTEEKR